MDDKDPTSIIQLIEDLRSGVSNFRRSGTSSRLSESGQQTPKNDKKDEAEPTPKRPKLDESIDSYASVTQLEVPNSPWEYRRMKGELIALQTRVKYQEATVEQLHKMRREMDEIFKKDKSLLELQNIQHLETIKQLEARLDTGRRNVQDAKEAQIRAEKELSQVKSKLEQKIINLYTENTKLKTEDKLNKSKSEVETIFPPVETKPIASDAEIKLEIAQKKLAELEAKCKETQNFEEKIETQNVELHTLRLKVEKLESDAALHEEGKKLAATAMRAIDLERDLEVAKSTIKNLRESARGKLLLEEQVANLEVRISHTERLEKEVLELELKVAELSTKIQEYESIGIEGGPIAIKCEVNRLQQAEVVLVAEEGQLRSKLESIQRDCLNTRTKLEESTKTITEHTSTIERLNKLISRLQKKMLLVSRERDSYRQQLDMYEKDMSATESQSPLLERIPALERTIDGYRDLISKLEADLDAESGSNEECKKLRAELGQLKGELEHRALKGDFNCKYKILHYTMNPAAIAGKEADEKHKALIEEVQTLRAAVIAGSDGKIPQTSYQTKEIDEMKKSYEVKLTRLKEVFKASSQEFRQACYQLFGWRVDRSKEGEYKLSSLYAESPDDFLFFMVGEDDVNLVETPFSATLTSQIEQFLENQHSVPMFLCAVQNDLFAQQTITET